MPKESLDRQIDQLAGQIRALTDLLAISVIISGVEDSPELKERLSSYSAIMHLDQ